MFAPMAALAVQNAVRAQEIEHLQTALHASRQIGVAIGILMARQLVTYDEAFGQLVTASQHFNRKVRDIALEVVDTGELPRDTAVVVELRHRRRGGDSEPAMTDLRRPGKVPETREPDQHGTASSVRVTRPAGDGRAAPQSDDGSQPSPPSIPLPRH